MKPDLVPVLLVVFIVLGGLGAGSVMFETARDGICQTFNFSCDAPRW